MKNVVILLIALMVISVGIMSGCIGGTSIKDIKEHPNNYLGKTITITGFYSGYDWIYQKKIFSDETEAMLSIEVIDGVDDSILIMGGEYQFTGIIKQVESYGMSLLHLEVSEIKAV